MGGPALQREGLRVEVDAQSLLSIGFTEILSRLPRIFHALKTLTRVAESRRPAVAVLVDYPDFHFKLAQRLNQIAIPVIDFIPPKVWVWRKNRVLRMKQIFSKVLCIFPFEETFYQGSGVPAVYVGNPLMDELPLKLTREEARRHLHLESDERVLLMMPGSRESELNIHVPLLLSAAEHAARRLGQELKILLPFPEALRSQPWVDRSLKNIHTLYPHLKIRVSWGDSHFCMVAADAGLIKSGTSTLEAALLGCPHAVVYKPGKITEWIFKYLIRYRGPVGLVNLALGWKEGEPYRAREWLCERATVENLSEEIYVLLTDPVQRAQLKKSFLPLVLGLSGKSASQTAARAILQTAGWVP